MTNILAVVVVVGLLQGKIIKPYPLSHPLFLVLISTFSQRTNQLSSFNHIANGL